MTAYVPQAPSSVAGNFTSGGTITGNSIISQGSITAAFGVVFAGGQAILNEYPGAFTPANSTLWFSSGVPPVAMGQNGDFALRFDGTGVGHTLLYHKETGAWVASAA